VVVRVPDLGAGYGDGQRHVPVARGRLQRRDLGHDAWTSAVTFVRHGSGGATLE
jgi:hypothetical protein